MKLDRKDKLSLLILVILIGIIAMDTALMLPNQVLIAAELGIDFAMIGVLIGLYVIISGVSTFIFGYLTDSYGRKKIVVIAGFLWAFSNIMHVFVQFY